MGLQRRLLAFSAALIPTYVVGPQPDGSYVVSDGTIITPAGTQVDLGIRVRAKAVAVTPTGNHTAAVLTMATSTSNGNGAVEIVDIKTGAVLQNYSSVGNTDSHGSEIGITYTPDGMATTSRGEILGLAANKCPCETLSTLRKTGKPTQASLSPHSTVLQLWLTAPVIWYGVRSRLS